MILCLMFSINTVNAFEYIDTNKSNLDNTDESVLNLDDTVNNEPIFGLGDNLQGPNSHLQYNTIPVPQGMKVQQPKL